MLQKFNLSFTSDLKHEHIRNSVANQSLESEVFFLRTASCAGLRCSINNVIRKVGLSIIEFAGYFETFSP